MGDELKLVRDNQGGTKDDEVDRDDDILTEESQNSSEDEDNTTNVPQRLYSNFDPEIRSQNVDRLCKVFHQIDTNGNNHLNSQQLHENMDLLNKAHLHVHRYDQLLQQHVSTVGSELFKPFALAQDLIQHFALDEQSWIAMRREELKGEDDDFDEELLLSGFTGKVNLLNFIQYMTKPLSRQRLTVGKTHSSNNQHTDARQNEQKGVAEEGEQVVDEKQNENENEELSEEVAEDIIECVEERTPKHELANIRFFTDLDAQGHQNKEFAETWGAKDISAEELQSVRKALTTPNSSKCPELDAGEGDDVRRGAQLSSYVEKQQVDVVSPGSDSKRLLEATSENVSDSGDESAQSPSTIKSSNENLMEVKFFQDARQSPRSPKHELEEV